MQKLLLVVLIVAAGIAVTCCAPVNSSESPSAGNETFDAEVVKVFAATDRNGVFRAYLVNWKGQEVIVSDPLVNTEYHSGDTITVLSMNQPYPDDDSKPRLLAFVVLPKK